eukprot:TRINITY_DN8681_c0_g6_i1.p1 TRINITY_DN8681_c0_g6~~TRINITY_DN8681_c0_g6_i1.p1  ORF type:complete len:299 (-),score=42.10 TRINITY_DN8681_c0_g6_i1:74-970(-)
MGCTCGTKRQTLSTKYIVGATMGRGSFGEVRKARKRDSMEMLAIKLIRVGGKKDESKDRTLDHVKNEALLMSRVQDHPNCVKMLEFAHEHLTFYIVMELCAKSLMQDLKNKPLLVDSSFARILKQMLAAISHCHSRRVVHRDVKPENFLYGRERHKTLKLCDFGLASAIPEEGYLTRVCGTAPYMAPEMVCHEPYEASVDVWSVGVVSYLLTFRQFPYVPLKAGDEEMKAVIREGTPEPFFTEDKRGAFLRTLLERSHQDRCSALEALQAHFLISDLDVHGIKAKQEKISSQEDDQMH